MRGRELKLGGERVEPRVVFRSPAMRGRELKHLPGGVRERRAESPAMRGRELKHLSPPFDSIFTMSPAMRGRELKQ